MRVLAQFLTSASDETHFPPPGLPEIAFLGRSNVGKSSLINSLVGSKIAKTSSSPGRTQTINFFSIRWAGKPSPELIFTDLPGYGYARAPREVSAGWNRFIEPYLTRRPTLALCIALVDPNIPPQTSDQQLIAFLSSLQRPFLVVATKSDRLSNNQRAKSLAALGQAFDGTTIVPISVKSAAGRDELWRTIRAAASVSPVLLKS
jgi:GTP-binding protein